MDVFSLLHTAKSKIATDVHLIVAAPPLLRINGALEPVDGMAPLTAEEINEAFLQLTTPEEREHILNLTLVIPYPALVVYDAIQLSSVGLSA